MSIQISNGKHKRRFVISYQVSMSPQYIQYHLEVARPIESGKALQTRRKHCVLL